MLGKLYLVINCELYSLRWNYGGLTQASEREDEAGYTEFGDEDSGELMTNQKPLFLSMTKQKTLF